MPQRLAVSLLLALPLLAAPAFADTTEDDTPPVYQLAFMCDGDKDVKLANDILSTIAPY